MVAGLTWRWAAVAAGTGALLSLPALAGALPAGGSDATAQQLLERVRSSPQVAWSGYGTSRGTLVVPDVSELSDLPGLIGETTRARAWWRGAEDWRVDAVALTGEVDTTRDPDGGWTWESADRRAVRIVGELDVRLPGAADLLAPVLGHRLAGTADVTASRLPARRVAGRAADGLRLVPRDPRATTVRSVDLWVEPGTGLTLHLEVRTAAGLPSLTSTLLDLDLAVPDASLTDFPRPRRASVATGRAPDIAAAADRFAPYALPDELAGLPRRARSTLSTGGGVGTYGDGFTALAVVPVPHDLGHQLVDRIDPQDDDGIAAIGTPLVNARVVLAQDERAYVLVGTVPPDRLATAGSRLRAVPPPFVPR